MKKMIVSLLFALSLAGCEQNFNTTSSGGNSEQEQSTEEPVAEPVVAEE